jgi:hypothetical protein
VIADISILSIVEIATNNPKNPNPKKANAMLKKSATQSCYLDSRNFKFFTLDRVA